MRRLRGRAAGLFVVVMMVGLGLGIVPAVVGPGAPGLGGGIAAAAGGNERIPEADWQARTNDYLAWATAQPLSDASVMSVLAYAERHQRDPAFVWDDNAPDPADYEPRFQQLREFKDTGDFSINDYLFLLLAHRDQLRPDLAAAFEERITQFKYWWTEPTPPGITDSQYYWTENHLIIFLANEYIAGQAYPDTVFTNSGMTGRQHMEHAKPLIMRWMSLRARFGWSEWLSNVYWMEDLKGLLLLADWSNDAELTQYSSALLDLMFVELASHLQNGAFGSTHGRSYLKDKMTSRDEDMFTMAKMVFDDTPIDYLHTDNVSLVATAHRYRPPEVARRIAKTNEVGVVKQRQSLPIDPHEPITPNPTPAYGLAYDDPLVWWAMGAQFPWQCVPMSVGLINTYNLFATDNFQDAAALQPIVASSTIEQLQQLAFSLATPVNPGLLSQVNTYTWRSPDVMLSTAQDWRKGQRSEQAHISQATVDPDALVFTTHPGKPAPLTAAEARSDGSAYWTGSASTPRALQHEKVNISIYAPQYEDSPGSTIPYLRYEGYTHAYFPTERFDEVVEQNGWVIGRKGDGYVALWSYRPTQWKTYGPGDYTLGLTQRFDLLAPGGPDNVWITEVGRRADFAAAPDPFAAFVGSITATNPTVTPLPAADGSAHTAKDGFDVDYSSPSAGAVAAGWNRAFSVAGGSESVTDYPRWDSPWTHVDFDTYHYVVSLGGVTIDHDLTALANVTIQAPTTTTTTAGGTPASGGSPIGGSSGVAPVQAQAVPRFTG